MRLVRLALHRRGLQALDEALRSCRVPDLDPYGSAISPRGSVISPRGSVISPRGSVISRGD